MDPVLQRLGDVTIQRLDNKPKEDIKVDAPQPDVNFAENDASKIEDMNAVANKRIMLNSPGPSYKRTRVDVKKSVDNNSVHSYSDEETDFDVESEAESDIDINAIKKDLEDNIQSDLEDNADYLPTFSNAPTEPATDNPELIPNVKVEHEDYDIDIKEKLKEMGEISFETVKKGDKPKKSDKAPDNEVVVTATKKSVEEENANERKGNLRRNIREVMDETKLDESTIAAQRQEMERLRRVQEQQRLLREGQRQMAQEKVISLLQGNNSSKAGTSRIGNTVLVKLPNGETKQMTKLHRRPFDLVKISKNSVPTSKSPTTVQQANLTPSVSIAPVGKKPMPICTSDTESDYEEMPPMTMTPPKPMDDEPITTIDISSDDDCIVVSESDMDPDDDDDEETVEDPGNSGLHTNDEFNQPDGQGRVVVNTGHAEAEADIYVAPQIARVIKPHQIGGVRFLFDNVIESVDIFDTSTGFGCILAHSMGLGKTLQVVCFSDIFLRHTCAKTILCIMPINTLQNWVAEYNMWLPTEDAAANSPLQLHGDVRPRNFNLLVLNDSHKTLTARAKVIHEWKTGGGVLLIGYEQYRLLSLKKNPKSRKKANPVVEAPPEDDKNKALFDEIHEALVEPGPDLVICDEGHRIKNSHASISHALKQMRTKRRIVLTGYPLQNNLMEYWCMVDFVRPNYLGTKTEFCNMFERPIQNGQCIDSTQADIKLMRYRAHVLHSLLVGFVQRRSHAVLQTALPVKEEYVLLVRMTPFQRTLYETFMNEVVRTQTVPNPLKAFAVCCKIWNHPDVLYYFLKKRAGGEAVDIDLEEVSNSTTTSSEIGGKKKGAKRNTNKKNNGKPAASVTPYNSIGEANNQQIKIKTEAGIPNTGVNFDNSERNVMTTNFQSQTTIQPYNNGNQCTPPYMANNRSNYPYASNNFSSTNNFQANQNVINNMKIEQSQGIHHPSQLPPGSHHLQSNQMMSLSNQNLPLQQNIQQNMGFTMNSGMNLQPSANQIASNMAMTSTNAQSNANMPVNQNMPVSSNMQMNANIPMTANSSMQISSTMSMNANVPGNNNMALAQNMPMISNMQGNPNMPATAIVNMHSNSPHMSGNNANSQTIANVPTNTNMRLHSNMSMGSNMSQNIRSSNNMPVNTNMPMNSSMATNPNLQMNTPMPNANVQSGSTLPTNQNVQSGSMQTNSSTISYATNTMGHNVNYSQTVQQQQQQQQQQYNQNKSVGNYSQSQSNQVNYGQGKSQMSNYQQNSSSSVQINYQNNFTNNNFQSQQQQQQTFQQNMQQQQNQSNAFSSNNSTNYSNFPNYQQNFWQDPNYKQNEYYGYNSAYNNGNLYGNAENAEAWIKKEDVKPNVFQSPIKTEPYETKPKINILSDIKLNNAFENASMKGDKKVKILSDIKFEMKKEETEDVKPEMKGENKETKTDPKVEVIDDDVKIVSETPPTGKTKEDTGIPYDWAIELLKDYIPGCIENSAKMQILFCIINESIVVGDRLLVFSQSLITLDLIEQFLQRNPVPGETQNWAKNLHYYRLDGSTSALEREKLINEFNSNSKIYLFLVSTRAGSLGINLIGANRVVVLDASWNPCHDTQAVCRVYRYGQKKPCFVYRLVVDNCLEKKIYDRQINKQGMSDRVVDECNPDAHLTIKDVSTLCWDDGKDEGGEKDWSHLIDNYSDPVLKQVLTHHGRRLNKEPFQHESLLVDRKDKQLSKQEKRLAKKGYEREKQAAKQPQYGMMNSVRGVHRPVASVRPMQQGIEKPSRWIPAEHWQRQGMTAQEMTLPLDVVIPTNQPEKGSIVLKAGQKVLVLKSPKGVYMQLENGKIVAIKTAIKVRGKADDDVPKVTKQPALPANMKNNASFNNMQQKRMTKTFSPTTTPKTNVRNVKQSTPNIMSRGQGVSRKANMMKSQTYQMGSEMGRGMKQGMIDTDTHQISSSDEEHRNVDMTDSMDSTTSLHESHRRSSNVDSESEMSSQGYRYGPSESKNVNSPLQQLEQSSSSIMADKHQYQEKLETITNSYQDADNSGKLQSNRPPITISDHETDEEPSYPRTPTDNQTKQRQQQPSQSQQQPQPQNQPPQQQQQQQQQVPVPSETVKSEIPPPEYGYANYYNYNPIQPYPPPPPNSQNYPTYPQQPPPYEVMAYPQQPQYNYGVYPPQGYPPQHQYPPPPPLPSQAPYDYNTAAAAPAVAPPSTQPIYSGYPAQPYASQQYPIPAQTMYHPPIPAPQNPPYDYQYPPPAAPPPATTPYYPNQ